MARTMENDGGARWGTTGNDGERWWHVGGRWGTMVAPWGTMGNDRE